MPHKQMYTIKFQTPDDKWVTHEKLFLSDTVAKLAQLIDTHYELERPITVNKWTVHNYFHHGLIYKELQEIVEISKENWSKQTETRQMKLDRQLKLAQRVTERAQAEFETEVN
jgi:hypothetical protein